MDIHDEILSEGDDEGIIKNDEKHLSKSSTEAQETKRNHTSIKRQVSLKTGFSVLNRERKGRDDQRKVQTRSGTSLGVFDLEAQQTDFSILKTKSSPSKQNSLLPRKLESQDINGVDDDSINEVVPAGRYFAALRGPELDEVNDYEDILLPTDEKWPFLLRFPIGCYGICLGLGSQAVLWRTMATSPATSFLHIRPAVSFAIWLLALAVLIAVSITYILKCIFYFEAVRREYFHPVRINFFFAPWIVCMFLAISVPSQLAPHTTLQPAIWCTFIVPYFLLELKIYGQWLSGGKRRLSKVANPSNHLSVTGNFVGAILASKVGWNEPAKFFWAVGFAHYLVVFVTLYQRLPTSEALPKELHPVYTMFIAAPSAASLAWESIYGEFDGLCRTCYFIALFLYIALVVRIKFFTGFGFSVAWWAYTFPMTTMSVATIKYAEQVPSIISKCLALGLAFMSSTMVSFLLVSTLLHAFVWHTLFPNDLAIAITKRKKGREKKPLKKAYDIKRWTKKALTKNSENKDTSKNNG
ncbi:guard cell S-type anion channel SLAC1 isoform X2 [Cicer arietinum]|uniref:Guard cell S-type anion channel SLAC1 isoform X2 n=1 Tax=Cicer arietinum TaxID=3827 RepID=A0A1S3DVE3_CICAR|nr:guard cell S-type anion channel SLAC1 isoform X2 [Cicer arietinum]